MEDIAARVHEVRERIAAACRRSGRQPGEVRLIAASKTQPAEAVRAAVLAGVDAIGENRVQEAAGKRPLVDIAVSWHLIGPLQRNKAKVALDLFDVLQTVDRIALADRLESLLDGAERVVPVFLEVNVGDEDQKSGIDVEGCPKLAEHILTACPHLAIAGLMAVPPYHPDPEHGRPFFVRLRTLAGRLTETLGVTGLELSMGMSEDFEQAVEEGATWVRLGRTLFGARSPKT